MKFGEILSQTLYMPVLYMCVAEYCEFIILSFKYTHLTLYMIRITMLYLNIVAEATNNIKNCRRSTIVSTGCKSHTLSSQRSRRMTMEMTKLSSQTSLLGMEMQWRSMTFMPSLGSTASTIPWNNNDETHYLFGNTI